MIMNQPIKKMTDAFSVKGYNVIVTGGNRGVGLGISEAYAQSGANVAILCRNKQSGEKVAEDLKQYGTNVFCVACDVGSFESVKSAADEVFKVFDQVDVLVNNAGISTNVEFLNDENLQEWHRVINTNLNGPAYMTYAVVPHMIKAGKGGSVINISSIGGTILNGAKNLPICAYRAAKAALNMYSRNMAAEFGDYGIRVNAIGLGPTHSDLDDNLTPEIKHLIENMPTHRFAEAIEAGALCVFLSSPAGNQITGTITTHDGGLSLG